MGNLKNTVLEVVMGVIPITAVVVILQFTFIWLPMGMFFQFLIGTAMVAVGLILFFMGVNIGLLPVGEMIGTTLPKIGKVWLIILFSVILGIAATIAEPDVRVLGNQVDSVTGGAIPQSILIYTVALGVGIFVGLAILRIFLNIPIIYLLLGGYILIFILILFTPAEFAPVSLDAGGVTTGPMTVPFILALGLGVTRIISKKTSSTDGFGLIALASIGPIISVLSLGVIYT